MNNNNNNKKKGGKKGKKTKKPNFHNESRDIQFKEDGQHYAKVIKVLGDCRVELDCYDGIKRIGHIRGAMRFKSWIASGDIVLIGIRDFQDSKCDIIVKYSSDEIKKLTNFGEIDKGETANGIVGGEENTDENCGFSFEDI